MPILIPQEPAFAQQAERLVWERLRDQLGEYDLLVANQNLSSARRDYEIDLIAVIRGVGVAVIEVKAGRIVSDEGHLYAVYDRRRTDVVEQVRGAKYALGDWLRQNSSYSAFDCWVHMVVLPYEQVSDEMCSPELDRSQLAGRDDMPRLGDFVRNGVASRARANRAPLSDTDFARLQHAFSGRSMPQHDLVADALEREEAVERLSQEQAVILGALRSINRVLIKGGAGAGKTWLGIEIARRLTEDGQRVALLCYSRGLAAWLQRRIGSLPRGEQPAYVGTFHGMGVQWGAPRGPDKNSTSDSVFWESELPEAMQRLAAALPEPDKYDAIVIDEAQDFADGWWAAIEAAMKDPESGGLYVLMDEGQQVFSRFGSIPGGLVPILLERNLRNTRQITSAFNSLAPIRMKPGDHDGPAVRFVECDPDDAMDAADDAVDSLLDEGFRPQDIAVLCTGRRHPEQINRQEADGETTYWQSFWDDDQVFYGHVLGFKGLERMVVVLVLNESDERERAKEKLYVGLSRARELLVVCGSSDYLEQVGGVQTRKQVTGR